MQLFSRSQFGRRLIGYVGSVFAWRLAIRAPWAPAEDRVEE
jgi:hypothetical protein